MTPTTRSLLRAAADGDVNIVRALIAAGTDVNETTEGGRTALMLAALLGHEDIVALLLNAGANAKLVDKVGLSAMDWAVRRGFTKITQLIGNASPNELADQTNATLDLVDSSVDDEAPVQISRYADVASETHPPPDLKASNQPEEIEVQPPKFGGAAGAILRIRAAEVVQQAESQEPLDTLAHGSDTGLSSTDVPAATDDVTTTPPTDVPAATDDVTTTPPTDVPVEPVAPVYAVFQMRGGVLDDDTTIAAATAEVSTLPATPPDIPVAAPPEEKSAALIEPEAPTVPVRTAAPAMNQSLDSSFDMRCPKCGARYESPRLRCPRDNTLLASIKVPSFSSINAHSSARPIVWLLIAITLGGIAFVAYRAKSYFSNSDPVPSLIAAKTEQPVALPVKTAPVIGGELVGTELFVPDAEYPSQAAAGTEGVDVSGKVTVRVHVNQKGKVISAQALDGDERLRGAAVKAGKKAAFSPEKLRGKGRTVTGTITYNFVAPQPSAIGPSNATASKAAGSAATASPTASKLSPVTGSSPANPSANSSATDGQFAFTGGPLAGTELNLPKPQYPSSAKSKGISGTIIIVVRVNRAGKVISWRTGDGDSQLRAAALKAAKQATFSPAKLPGNGEVVGTITYNFKL